MIYKILGFLLFGVLPLGLQAEELNPELVLKSFLHSFPGKVQAVEFVDGDWTIGIRNETFCWAQGKLLPLALKANQESYVSQMFSLYPKDIPDPSGYTQGEIEALRTQGSREARLDRVDPHNGFIAALYGGITRVEIEAHQVKTVFLGKNIVVHEDIVKALERVEHSLRSRSQGYPEIAAFIDSINSIGGYNWRQIQGTRRLSYHSWGLALDILPKQLGNKVMYWFWERISNSRWMTVPLERRWIPPLGVIQAFENEGFIWGGRWALYDNMHFEYRPELHEMNRLLAAESQIAQAQDTPQLHHVYPLLPKGSFFQRVRLYLGLKN